MSTKRLIDAVAHLIAHGPVTTTSGRPCAYDVGVHLGLPIGETYGPLHRLADEGLLVETPNATDPALYPPEFSTPTAGFAPKETT